MQTFSSLHDPTVWRTIPVLEFLIKTWENMAALPRFDKVREALIEGLDNLAKWYKKTDDSTAYFISLGMIHKIDDAHVSNQYVRLFLQLWTPMSRLPMPSIIGVMTHSIPVSRCSKKL